MEHNGSVLLPTLHWGDMAAPEGDFLLPAGTVTMLLADVSGSTRRWEQDESAMAAAMAEMRADVGELIGRHHGVRPLEQGEGDSFVAAFARPSEAVACALDVIRTVTLPLRIGIHCGEAQRSAEGTYVGPALNRAARLRDSAHGSQVVLSQPAAELVAERLPERASLRDLGSHRLRDLARAERIFQLLHPDLLDEFPPLRTLDTYRHNLPLQRTHFFGREAESSDVVALLGEQRLVTLTGPGGCGKTRLALHVAAELLDEHPDGVFFADLSSVTEGADVARAVARAVGLTEEAMNDVAGFLRGRAALLVIDNCEQVIDAAAAFGHGMLDGAPGVRMLTTSREALRVDGESTFVVPPLAVPPDTGPVTVEGLRPYAAADLFVDRARRARADFTLVDDDAAAVADICRRLDGVPLAIELAAARVRVLALRQIRDGLDERFRLLTGGARTALPRQQTLTASVDWSHDLLTEIERTALRRLTVFAGSFDIDAAAAVAGALDGIEHHQVLDVVSLLVDKSLVEVDSAAPRARYRLLETIRQYAREKLRAADEEDAALSAHRDHYLQVAEVVRDAFAFETFLEERDNLEAAFRFAVARGDLDESARLFIGCFRALDHLWIGAVIDWAREVVPQAAEVSEPWRADLLVACKQTWLDLPGVSLADACQRSIEWHRKSGDDRRLGGVLLVHALETEPFDEAAVDSAVARLVGAGDSYAGARGLLGATWYATYGTAERWFGDAVALVDALDGTARTSMAGPVLGPYGWINPAAAIDAYERLFVPEAGRGEVDSHSQVPLVGFLIALGRLDEAEALSGPVMQDRRRVGDLSCLARLQTDLAIVAHVRGDHAAASKLIAEARTIEQSSPVPSEEDALAVRGLFGLAHGDVAAVEEVIEQLRGGAPWSVFAKRYIRAALLHLRGHHDDAEALVHEALSGLGAVSAAIRILNLLASIAASVGASADAARLLGAVSAHRNRTGIVSDVEDLAAIKPAADRALEDLGPDAYEKAWQEGFALDIDDALAWVRRGRGQRRRPATGWRSLTPTELQVVDLVAAGHANKEIAARLFMSIRTVTTHLTHIYTKLDLASRPELVAAAATRTLPPS